MKKSLFLSLLLLSGCSVAPEETPPCACDDYVPPYVKPPSASNQENIQQLLAYIAQKAKGRWGEDEFVEAGKHRYVKYLDGYNTRAHIDFEAGKIYVSTISQYQPTEKLQKAIVQTLLMPADPAHAELFSDKEAVLRGKPFYWGKFSITMENRLNGNGAPIVTQTTYSTTNCKRKPSNTAVLTMSKSTW